ncbi:CaiB/BaiF CoA transferase family protein [Ottowia thiooxydans]|uniref:CaiB/BaiF CoA transferase family protein n=1 Tax=Ottowia thiooxydans TaxID=219182 RepID=UPI000419B461|nr:CoA transferase [Ottowia thiooxydans]
MTTKLPLAGIRVLDLSHVIAGPMASFYLAQFGAEVIKIETPAGGDVMRSSKAGPGEGDTPTGFVSFNAGKKSMAIDIRKPEGHEAVRALAASADVFIENFRPGVVAKYGLDYESIKAVKPDIIYCSVSGYGQQGDWSERGAYDHVVQALTGMMMMSGDSADAPPLKVGFPVIDVAAGLLGALSVVSAVHQRSRDGTGARIDVSMVQAAMTLMYPNASAFLTQRVEPQRVGNRGYTGSPTADTYQCNDGWLSTAANTPAQFRKLTKILELEHLCEDGNAIDLAAFNAPGGGFVVARDMDYVRQQFNAAFAQRSARDMEEQLNAVGVPAARVRRLGEFLDEVESGSHLPLPVRSYGQGDRTIRTPGLGFTYVGEDSELRAGAPSLGQHTEALLRGGR